MDTMLALGKVVAQREKLAAYEPLSQTFQRPEVHGALAGAGFGGLAGGSLGAIGGGVHGLAFPGRDEEGKKRSRVREALKRALMVGIPGAIGGGAIGGTAGYGIGGLLGAMSRLAEQGASRNLSHDYNRAERQLFSPKHPGRTDSKGNPLLSPWERMLKDLGELAHGPPGYGRDYGKAEQHFFDHDQYQKSRAPWLGSEGV